MQISQAFPEVTVKKAYILIGAVMYSILGCSGAKKSPLAGTQPLSKTQMVELRTVNVAQASALTAARTALGSPVVPEVESEAADAPDEKATTEKLVKLIKDGNCAQTIVKAEDRYDVSWRSEWHVASEKCPINLGEVTDYVYEQYSNSAGPLSRGILTVNTSLEMQDDFQVASGLSGHQKTGKLERKKKNDGSFEVAGKFEYEPFQVANVGRVDARIEVLPLWNGGSILLQVGTANTVASVKLTWTKSGKKTIVVNGAQILDEKTFKEMFSSFEVLELLEKIKKMG